MGITYSDWLREKMKDRGISNAELARRAGVSATYIGNLIKGFSANTRTGKIKPSEEVAEKIATSLGISVDEGRIAAGYAPKFSPEVHGLMETVQVSFLDSSFTPEEQERLLDMMRTLVAGAMAAKGKKNEE